MVDDAVEFRLSDGTSLLVPDADLRRLYEALWDLSDNRGAISTAALVMEEARKQGLRRRPVELSVTQTNVLRQAARFANLTE